MNGFVHESEKLTSLLSVGLIQDFAHFAVHVPGESAVPSSNSVEIFSSAHFYGKGWSAACGLKNE
jgi:hypothetical protein